MRGTRTAVYLALWAGLSITACQPTSDPAADARVVLEVDAIDSLPPGTLTLPNGDRSVKFAVIGDSGRGSAEQYAVAAQMDAYRQQFDYRFVLMAGDNIYEGPATPEDYRTKFETPYKPLLDAGVRFFATLGNHDDPRQVDYPPLQHAGASLLHLHRAGTVDHRAEYGGALLRARQHQYGWRSGAMARAGAGATDARLERGAHALPDVLGGALQPAGSAAALHHRVALHRRRRSTWRSRATSISTSGPTCSTASSTS